MENLSLGNGLDELELLKEGTGLSDSSVLDTGLYQALLKYIYFTTNKSGTKSANAVVEINGLTHTYSMCFTYKETNSPTKVVNGKTQVIPGYRQLNNLCFVASGKPVNKCEQEEKTILVYDRTQKKEVPTMVNTIKDVMGAKIGVGIKKIHKHKTALMPTGVYVPTTEMFYTNEVDDWYTAEGLSAQEAATGKSAEKALKWKEKAGQVFEEKLKVEPIAPPTNSLEEATQKKASDLFL